MRFTKLNYYQYLLSSQINYTLTNLAEHLEQISHDKINLFSSATKTPGCSHVYCLVVWRAARLHRAIACDSCVSPEYIVK